MSYGFKLFTGPNGELPVEWTDYAPGLVIAIETLPDTLTHDYTYDLTGFSEVVGYGIKKLPNGAIDAAYLLGAGIPISQPTPGVVRVGAGVQNTGSFVIVMAD